MDKQELKNKIIEFCKSKNFDDPFIQECITEFIERHTELYGNIIPAEDLFKRLEDNLDKITFADRNPDAITKLGEYQCRNSENICVNEIILYYSKSKLTLSDFDKTMLEENLYTESDKSKVLQNLANSKAEIKSTLIHELTHAAYTIKDPFGNGEQHIFSKSFKEQFSGEYRNFGNNNTFEAIANYISSRIENTSPDQLQSYKAETQAIYMLAEKLNEYSIIKSAWDSDEGIFKTDYINEIVQDKEKGEDSYSAFQKGMSMLVLIREKYSSDLSKTILENEKILGDIQKIIDGTSYELESQTLKNTNTQPIENNYSPIIFEKDTSSLFTLKIARLLEKNKSLMSIPFIKNFVKKQFNVLPPEKKSDENPIITSYDNAAKFNADLSHNGKFQDLKPLHEENQIPNNNLINEKDELQ